MKKLAASALLACLPGGAMALEYQVPPAEIMTLADYERAPSIKLDSKREYLLLRYKPTYKTLGDLNQKEMRLGGLRVNPVTNIDSEITYYNNLKVRKVSEKKELQVSGLPEEPRIAHVTWSPDEKTVAFTHTADTGVELWALDVASAKARRMTGPSVNANLGNPYEWLADSKSLIVRMLPAKRTPLIDTGTELPKGPSVSEGDGTVSQNRTYQDLLKNPQDERNFEILLTSELHRVSLSGRTRLFRPAAMHAGEGLSPDGKYLLSVTLEKPFSYIVPLNRFPQKTVIYDMKGKAVKTVNEVPLNETMPKGFGAVRKGRRYMGWREDKPATLHFVQALDGGDPANKAEYRDEVFLWKAPFGKKPVPLAKVKNRVTSIKFTDNGLAVIGDWWYDTRNRRTYLVNTEKPGSAARVLYDRNYQDIYSDPGDFEERKLPSGNWVIRTEGGKAWLLGDGYTKDGQFPFIDELDLETFKTKRLYRSELKGKKESLVSLEDPASGEVLTWIQSATDYPNYYFRNIKTGDIRQITDFPNPFESLKKVSKEVIKYKRKDGVELSGTLYLPAGYKKGKKLPLLVWAYPREFKDRKSAGQSDKNPNDFIYPHYGSFVYWVARGYAVLDHASFPIVGEGKKEPNDTFIEQLLMNARAAIDAVDRKGVIDRRKVAVGGHSYGAFMVANLLTHSDLFACGIARSGAYNRTLTPFGFQGEQRNYWDAPGIYNGMSPFMSADRMNKPLLLVHGADDNNPGTFTLQTERYFQALKNLGAPVRLVLLPKESHGYRAKENIFHLLWEQDRFLGVCLKKG